MLNQDKLLWFLFMIGLFSCENNNESVFQKDYLTTYHKTNFNKYKDIYSNAIDSIKKWKKDSLSITSAIFYSDCWQLDSAFIFNEDSTRFFTTVNSQNCEWKNSEADLISEFGGAKIDGKWYFFYLGNYMIVPREVYQDSVSVPLTFEELSWVAHKEIISGSVVKSSEGVKANNQFFDSLFYSQRAWNCNNCNHAQFDSLLISNVKRKYDEKLDPAEIEDVKKNIEESEPSLKSEEKKNWFQNLFSKSKPFD